MIPTLPCLWRPFDRTDPIDADFIEFVLRRLEQQALRQWPEIAFCVTKHSPVPVRRVSYNHEGGTCGRDDADASRASIQYRLLNALGEMPNQDDGDSGSFSQIT